MKIELRQWNLEDAESLIELCNSADGRYLSNRLPHPYTGENADWWLNMVMENEGVTGLFRAITLDGKVVGNITVEKKSDVYGKDAEIGYLLHEEYSGNGIMTEAAEQMCKIAFKELDIIRISGLVYEPNIASSRVLEKNEFTLEGVLKNGVVKDNNIYDLKIYGKLK